MTILVFSDSHGHMSNMRGLIKKFMPDFVIHLGDYARDAGRLEHPQVIGVYGNCNYNINSPKHMLVEIAGKRFMLTHGHAYGVKQGLDNLIRAAVLNDADAVLYGHTHKQYYARRGNMVILNPGPADERAALLTVGESEIEIELL